MQQFDYIFAGFGLSGMTLFYELSKDPDFAKKSVLIVDRDAKTQNDRTWSFWAEKDIEFQHLVKKQWKRGEFYAMSGEHIPLRFENHCYNTIEGADFYAFMNQFVSEFSNVQRIQADILSLSNAGILQTNRGDFSGKLVFRSFFDKSDFKPESARQFIWQHFYGYVIKNTDNQFDTDTFTFMDYRHTDAKLTNFLYVLPYTSNEALIEFTEFSPKLYKIPFCCAAVAFCCDQSAKASWSSREMWYKSTKFSAVSPMPSVPYISCIFGLMKRHPKLVSNLKMYLSSLRSPTKKVIFIDEMPWLDTHKSDFRMYLGHFWNTYCEKRNDIIIVLCGSAASYMVQNVLSNKGSLHARLSYKLHIKPFTLYETLIKRSKHAGGGAFTRALEELIASGFVTKYPAFDKKNQKMLYRLTDEYSKFYLKYIEPNKNQGDNFWKTMSQQQSYISWAGKQNDSQFRLAVSLEATEFLRELQISEVDFSLMQCRCRIDDFWCIRFFQHGQK
jgi:hypothetical protein